MAFSSIINNFSKVHVLCIGDVMLDHFIYGKVERISPEAPVPVFNRISEKQMLGGAGNVVSNLYALGCSAELICFIGCDNAGQKVRQLLSNICAKSLPIEILGSSTIEKTRIIAGNNHLLRIDQEDSFDRESDIDDLFDKEVEKRILKADIVLLSDYAKGILNQKRCQRIVNLSLRLGKKVVIDPKGSDYSKYTGATLVKPNLKEFNQITGITCSPNSPNFLQCLKAGAHRLFECFHIQNLLITLSEHGMAFISAKEPEGIFQIPTTAREVFDVSGAGDTSLAMLGASLAAGADIHSAIKLANLASGIVVGKLGTSIVTTQEVLNELSKPMPMLQNNWNKKNKIISIREAIDIAHKYRNENLKIGFTNGCFDLLHQGHLHSLMQARQQCDVLMIGLNKDVSVKRLKGDSRPIQDEKTRSLLLSSLEFVDFVIMFEEDTAVHIVDAIRPDFIFKEGYAMPCWPEGQLVESYGGKAIILSRLEGYSTSDIVHKIRQ